jgi:hypothetical protein
MVIMVIEQGDRLGKFAVLVCTGFMLLTGCSERGNVTIFPVAEPAVLQPMVSSFDDFWAAMRHFDGLSCQRPEIPVLFLEAPLIFGQEPVEVMEQHPV